MPEIPLYHVLNACISFGNLYGEDSSAYGVTCLLRSSESGSLAGAAQQQLGDSSDSASKPLLSGHPSGVVNKDTSTEAVEQIDSPKCIVDESVFDVGRDENSPGHYGSLDEEEQMVQMAVQRSLAEHGGSDQLLMREYSLQKRGLLECRNSEYVDPEEAMLQKAIVASLSVEGEEIPVTSADDAYIKAIEASKQELLLEERRARAEEEELKRVLEMSKLMK
ncbi:unnamed protein product [Protopolystoma xenopodis]|uniref:Uncharacterized protein n=1 Tax=Protopolystoma xenopodis TaxID=117903 RepID=A0A3S5AX29_9PLAT|nr:unnamed protein product [Protopolystoma xenopodis]